MVDKSVDDDINKDLCDSDEFNQEFSHLSHNFASHGPITKWVPVN